MKCWWEGLCTFFGHFIYIYTYNILSFLWFYCVCVLTLRASEGWWPWHARKRHIRRLDSNTILVSSMSSVLVWLCTGDWLTIRKIMKIAVQSHTQSFHLAVWSFLYDEDCWTVGFSAFAFCLCWYEWLIKTQQAWERLNTGTFSVIHNSKCLAFDDSNLKFTVLLWVT